MQQEIEITDLLQMTEEEMKEMKFDTQELLPMGVIRRLKGVQAATDDPFATS